MDEWMEAARVDERCIANKDLWLQLDRAYAALRGMPRVTVTLQHVKGHSGDVGNDGADALAVVTGAQRAAVGGEIGSMDSGSSSRGSRAAATSTSSQPPAKKRRTTTTTIASSSKRCYNYAMASLELYPHGTQRSRLFLVGSVKRKKFKSDAEAQAFCRAHPTSTFDIVD
jgi:hypothetical protein